MSAKIYLFPFRIVWLISISARESGTNRTLAHAAIDLKILAPEFIFTRLTPCSSPVASYEKNWKTRRLTNSILFHLIPIIPRRS